ncbi:MAG: hypothetical protein AMXMBFR4_26710 [Candidatus Hydrogenedentota bacterium]
MLRACAISLIAVGAARAENLLQNPGFEFVEHGVPRGWNVYVEPKQGADASVDESIANEGARSVKLTIPEPYHRDPANNWSQNILRDLGGKRLHVRGFIKTDDAGEAALWLQAYRKKPWGVLAQESTSDKTLITRTNDWTPVEMTVDVPEGSDFVVLRCVLRGHGTAWFDGLSVEIADVPAPVSQGKETPDAPKVPALPAMPQPGLGGPPLGTTELQRAQEALRAANDALKQSNAALTQQIEQMRREIEELRAQVKCAAEEARALKQETEPPPSREEAVRLPVPPLVPVEPDTGDE